jgi:hypothetical protein
MRLVCLSEGSSVDFVLVPVTPIYFIFHRAEKSSTVSLPYVRYEITFANKNTQVTPYFTFKFSPSLLLHIQLLCSLYLLTPWSTVLLQKLTSLQLVKNSPHFMEPEGSSPHSQVPKICPYPEPVQSNP